MPFHPVLVSACSKHIKINIFPLVLHISPLCVCVCAPRCFISCFSFEILHVRSFIKQCGTKNSWSEGGSTETCWKRELEKKGGRAVRKILFRRRIYAFKNKKSGNRCPPTSAWITPSLRPWYTTVEEMYVAFFVGNVHFARSRARLMSQVHSAVLLRLSNKSNGLYSSPRYRAAQSV